MGRILVIRGGAIGDFILTLPSLALIREGFPECQLEVMGYQRVLPLVSGRPYADRTRNIEYGPLAACFNPAARMAEELVDYFGSFGQIISYLYDPDCLFERSLRGAGVKNYLPAIGKVAPDGPHATEQLAAPLQSLALFLEDPHPKLHFHPEELEIITRQSADRVVAIHPGSGSASKNWPLENWLQLAVKLLESGSATSLRVVGGEADRPRLTELKNRLGFRGVTYLEDLPLRKLAVELASCRLFVGHDSGISHLAAAAGCPVVALFGPTDPTIWSPRGPRVRVLGNTNGEWVELAEVIAAVQEEL